MPALLHIASKELSKVRPAVWRALRVVLWSTNSGLPVLCLFAATLWVARYWYSAEFGLYEDDFTRAPRTMTADLPLLGRLLADNFSRLSEHGKIFHAPLLDFFAFLGGKLGALGTASPFRGAYLLGFSLHLLSAGLFYTLLQRIARGGSSRQPALPFPDLFALLGGLAFCLFCADTTQVWLTRSFGLQPALILLLLAFHSYLAGRKPLAYLLAGLILLVYENPFPVFLAAPLLETPAVQITAWDRRWLKATLCHIAILSIFLLATLLLRRLAGEDRASSLETTGALQTVLTHSVYGPLTSLKGMLSRPYQIARSLFGAGDPKPDVLTSLALFTPLFTCALWIAARPLCFGQRSSLFPPPLFAMGRVGWGGLESLA